MVTKPQDIVAPATKKKVTGEELYQMPETELVELVKGEIVNLSPTGFWHGHVENRFGSILDNFVQMHKLGFVSVGEVGIYTGRNPDTIRAADVIFISHQRLVQVKSQSYLDVAPELVVAVLSPSDSWSEVMTKLDEYFQIGVEAVWIADPAKREVFVYHTITDVQRFSSTDSLSDEKILPGFNVPVEKLFASQ